MERRKLLLGSGAALATVLAGCSSSETSDDGEGDDTEDITGNGNENGDENGNENGDENGDEDLDTGDVPGFDGTKLDVGSDVLTVKKVNKKGDKMDIVVKTDVVDLDELYAEFEPLAGDLESAIDDLAAFADTIKTLEVIVDHEGNKVVSLFVNVDWLVDYYDGNLEANEFFEKVKDSAE